MTHKLRLSPVSPDAVCSFFVEKGLLGLGLGLLRLGVAIAHRLATWKHPLRRSRGRAEKARQLAGSSAGAEVPPTQRVVGHHKRKKGDRDLFKFTVKSQLCQPKISVTWHPFAEAPDQQSWKMMEASPGLWEFGESVEISKEIEKNPLKPQVTTEFRSQDLLRMFIKSPCLASSTWFRLRKILIR